MAEVAVHNGVQKVEAWMERNEPSAIMTPTRIRVLKTENEKLREALRWRFPPEAPEIGQLCVVALANWRWCATYESDPDQWGGSDDETKEEEFIFNDGGGGEDYRLDEITAWYPVQSVPVIGKTS